MKKSRSKSWIPLRVIELGVPFALFVSFVYFVFRFDFEPIAKVCIPAVAVFFGFSSLLYNRARAYSRGRSRIRSFYAAERALQATLFALVGTVVGIGMYAIFVWYGFWPGQELSKKHGFLLLFLIPLLIVQTGFSCFMISIRIVSQEFLRPISVRELHKRIRDGL